MLIKFSPVKMLWFVLPCALFAACGDDGLHDYVNDHVIGAQFGSVQNADGSPVERLPSGEIVWADAETPPVLRVILDNPRRTVYGVTYSGNGSASVKRAAQDTADLSSLYIELTPADDVVMRVVDGNWYGDISINVRLIPPSGKIPPDDIFLSILRKYPEQEDEPAPSWSLEGVTYADGVNEGNVVAILKTWNMAMGYATLAEAVDNSPDQGGTVILVKSAEIDAPIVIKKNVLLVAIPGQAQAVTVSPQAMFSGSLFTVERGVSFTFCGNGSGDITLQNSNGSAVTVEGTFNMKGGVISDNAAQVNGGGVYVSESGSFTMSGGVIRDNTAQKGGGGVCVGGGDFEMTGGKISGNTALTGTGGFGGGVYVSAGTFTMSAGEISDNTAVSGGGGGVCVLGGGFEMSGGKISGNTANANSGGGVYVDAGTFTISGGEISGNRSGSYGGGGGVYVDGGDFEMTGGEISGNTSGSGFGGGVYVGGAFTMSGGAVVAQDVYLPANKTIGVSGSLAPPQGKQSAIIAMEITTVGTTVLEKARGTLTTDDISKFKLNTDPPKAITISGGSKGVIASANMSATVNGQLVYYASLADAIAAATGTLQSPAVISLMDDIDVSASIAVDNGKHITIVPSGGEVTINRSGSFKDSLFTVGTNASLTLAGSGNAQLVLDGGSDNGLTATAALVTVNNTGTLTMNDGVTLKNNENTSGNTAFGGGVYIEAYGDFTMTGGEISGNTASGGGGVYVVGVFTMSGGKISENTAFGYDDMSMHETGYGGGVFVENGGSVELSNCEISKNTTIGNGGGVYVSGGSVIMSNCEISENEAPHGGGVYIVGGKFTMYDGKISGNTASGHISSGGGICVLGSGDFTMSGGEISDNTTSGNNSNGGGVYISGDGDFTMTGGKISDNTATDISATGYTGHGGGIYVESGGGVTMSGGKISGNTAFGNGNGVYVKVNTNISSPFIMSARAVVAQDVYMASGKTICVSGEMELPEGFTHSATIMGDNAAEGTVVLTGVPPYVLKTADISKFVFDKGGADGLMEVVPGSDSDNTGVIGAALVG